jgi:hypothetical protein
MDLFPSSDEGWETPAQLGPSERANLNHWTLYVSITTALVFMDLVCWLGLLHKISTSFSILVLGLCMPYYNLYCTFSCYLPLTKSGLRYLYSCSYADIGCPVSSPDGKLNFIVFFRIPDDGQSPKPQYFRGFVHHRQNTLESTSKEKIKLSL